MSTTQQTIQLFYDQAQKKDFARLNQFRLVRFGKTTLNETDFVYVETAQLPAKRIVNHQVPYLGLNFNVPGTVSYEGSESYSVRFRCDQNYNYRRLFEDNLIRTFDDQTSTGAYATPDVNSQVVMVLLDKQLLPLRTYTLYGVYIISVESPEYDIKDTASIISFNVTLAYQYWRATPVGRSRQLNAAIVN